MAYQEKQLYQGQVPISAASIYSPAAGVTTIIKEIWLRAYHSSSVYVEIYVDDDGTTYDDTTVIYKETFSTGAGGTRLPCNIFMNDDSGNLAVDSDVAAKVTITVFGVEIS